MGTCPLCTTPCDPNVLGKAAEVNALAPAVTALIRSLHPDWWPSHGLCPDCAGRFAHHLAELRSHDSLQHTTQPHGTFPYYHQDEATVLSQAQRLAHHWQFTGAGITIAFLDSGFYPHPDLSTSIPLPKAPTPLLALKPQRDGISRLPNRFIHYALVSGKFSANYGQVSCF